MRVYRSRQSYEASAKFTTWLYRIAYHCALKQLERRKRERSLQAAIEAEQILEEVNKQKQAEDILELHAQQAMVREQHRALRMPAHQRQQRVERLARAAVRFLEALLDVVAQGRIVERDQL